MVSGLVMFINININNINNININITISLILEITCNGRLIRTQKSAYAQHIKIKRSTIFVLVIRSIDI